MKRLFSLGLAILCLLITSSSKGQFTSGANGLFMKSGALVTIAGLTIAPDIDLALNNTTLLVQNTPIPGSPNTSILRVYVFNEPLHLTGKLGILFLPGELNGNVEANLQVATSAETDNGYVTSTGSTVDQARHYVHNTFNGADIRVASAVETGSVLPVRLVRFTAKKESRTALLQWRTSFETNSDFFEVQRSLNGKEWQAIGRVNASGESKTDLHYTFSDPNPSVGGKSGGENLYRLKMTDHDGTFAYSMIRSLRFESLAEIALFPNPTAEKIQITVPDWENVQQIHIVNTAGHLVYESGPAQLESISANGIQVRNLPVGSYFVKITDKDGLVHSLKMMKF